VGSPRLNNIQAGEVAAVPVHLGHFIPNSTEREMSVKPFGTGPGVFGCASSELRIVMAFQLGMYWMFQYESDAEAEATITTLREALDQDNPVSQQLREKYSGPNMRAFLFEFLPRDGLTAFNRMATVVVDVHHGAQEVSPDGECFPLNPEDVVSSNNLEEIEPCIFEATPKGTLAMNILRLPSESRWGGIATVRDQLGPTGWNEVPPDGDWR
jgi:hypothetical protein